MCTHSDLDMYSLFAYGRSRNIHSNISVEFSGTPNNGTPYPYYSHTTPTRIPKDMGIVREAYHKGVPLLGVLGITLKYRHSPHALASSSQSSPFFFKGGKPDGIPTLRIERPCFRIRNVGDAQKSQTNLCFARDQWGRATNTQQFTCGR